MEGVDAEEEGDEESSKRGRGERGERDSRAGGADRWSWCSAHPMIQGSDDQDPCII